MTKYTTYQICSRCFSYLICNGNMDSSQPLILVDALEGFNFTYLLDESVPCDPEVHDEQVTEDEPVNLYNFYTA